MEPDRITQLTRRIEAAGDLVVETLGRVESALADRAAVEVTARDAVAERTDAPSTHALVRPVSTGEQWLRLAAVIGCAALGTLLVRRFAPGV